MSRRPVHKMRIFPFSGILGVSQMNRGLWSTFLLVLIIKVAYIPLLRHGGTASGNQWDIPAGANAVFIRYHHVSAPRRSPISSSPSFYSCSFSPQIRSSPWTFTIFHQLNSE